MYINQNLDLPVNDDSLLNNFDIDSNDDIDENRYHQQQLSFKPDDNEPETIHISKRVKSIRQLKKIEVSQVRLLYKNATLRGLGSNLKDIQLFIAESAGIWIERTGMEYLKKSEEQESRDWYLRLAKDSFAYVYAYRESMDKIVQLERNLWEIFEDPKTTQMGKVKTIRELHKLVITETLLLRDLPFVTNLSKCHDLSKLGYASPGE